VRGGIAKRFPRAQHGGRDFAHGKIARLPQTFFAQQKTRGLSPPAAATAIRADGLRFQHVVKMSRLCHQKTLAG
jgi:hypothetical protein